MKEVKIADLDKKDLKMMEEASALEKSIKEQVAQLNAKTTALWQEWKAKYKFGTGLHYIKDKAIYTQVI